jgi:Uma2 family endonuclease
MTAHVQPKMTVDEFLAWAEDRPGRYELVEGEVFAMSPERARHAEVKFAVQTALADAIRAAGTPCRMLPDGMTVRVGERTAYEPDALVYCGERLPGDAVEVPNPLVVIEVLSPGTKMQDTGAKLTGYFDLASLQHYLIIDPVRNLVIHHRRAADAIETRIASEGILRLDPPGIELSLDGMFAGL